MNACRLVSVALIAFMVAGFFPQFAVSGQEAGTACETVMHDGYPVLQIDGAPFFPFGGDIHYWRIPAESWGAVLDSAVYANCNLVSTYVPWNWHEYLPGQFDFTGASGEPRRNLAHFIELCQERGLKFIARPGPFICSEWTNGGYPEWLVMENFPDIWMRSNQEQYGEGMGLPYMLAYKGVGFAPIGYLQPKFLEAVGNWYDAFAGFLKPYLATNGGPVIMVQIDNEPCYYYQTGAFDSDYSPLAVELFKQIYGLDAPYAWPAAGGSADSLVTGMKWQEYKAWVVAEYVRMLSAMMRENGIDVPLLGCDGDYSGYQDVGIREKAEATLEGLNLYSLLFTDTAPAQWSRNVFFDELFQSAQPWQPTMTCEVGQVSYMPAYTRFMGSGDQAASPVFDPVAAASDALGNMGSQVFTIEEGMSNIDLITRLPMAHGLASINYYMLAGRIDPVFYPSAMTTVLSTPWNLGAPIGPDGSRRDHLEMIRGLGEFAALYNEFLADSHEMKDLAIGYYHPYIRAPANATAYGLKDEIAEQAVINQADAVGGLVLESGVSYEMAYLEGASPEELAHHPLIFAICFDYMDAETQMLLVDYVENGGTLVCWPRTPYMDCNMKPCTILRDELFCAPVTGTLEKARHNVSSEIGVFTAYRYSDEFDMSGMKNCVEFATDENGKTCAYAVEKGKGIGLMLGTYPSYNEIAEEGSNTALQPTTSMSSGVSGRVPAYDDTDKAFVNKLVDFLGFKKYASASSTLVDVSLKQRNGGTEGLLFITNVYPENRTLDIEVWDSIEERIVRIPAIAIPARSGISLPINKQICDGALLKYATCELRNVSIEGGEITLKTYAPAGSGPSKMAFEISGASNWKVDGSAVAVLESSGLFTIEIPEGVHEIYFDSVEANEGSKGFLGIPGFGAGALLGGILLAAAIALVARRKE